MGQFKLKPSGSQQQPYYFTLVATNGLTLATSETYTSKQAAINGMQAVVEALNVKPVEYDDLTT
ncbi:YegP family protein [Microbacterium arborescens]|uniref:YegP family protein n=1 Tax=Microbacterium arborescens TaxID=33883 RepID=UPI000DF85B66|nr:YegP family protein [Microbacterium arborescens]